MQDTDKKYNTDTDTKCARQDVTDKKYRTRQLTRHYRHSIGQDTDKRARQDTQTQIDKDKT